MASTLLSASADASWQPKVVIFDLLTALLNSWELWDASTPSASEVEGRKWRGRYLEITFGAGSYVPYEDLVRQAAREAGLPESAPTKLLSSWSSLAPWPETAEVLQTLKQRGYKLGVVTNCSKRLGTVAASKFDGVGSGGGSSEESPFDAAVTAEESGYYKPVKAAYEAILSAMGVDASDALFVAGSAGDVQGATNAGMRVVWHNHVGLAPKGDAVPLRQGRTLNEALQDFL